MKRCSPAEHWNSVNTVSTDVIAVILTAGRVKGQVRALSPLSFTILFRGRGDPCHLMWTWRLSSPCVSLASVAPPSDRYQRVYLTVNMVYVTVVITFVQFVSRFSLVARLLP